MVALTDGLCYAEKMKSKDHMLISKHDRVLGGVFAAMGNYAEVNPNILRAGYVVVSLLYPIQTVIVYGIFYYMIPKDDRFME
jgi:phage shock protein PspC (stress-responsive transcriptional regulator)